MNLETPDPGQAKDAINEDTVKVDPVDVEPVSVEPDKVDKRVDSVATSRSSSPARKSSLSSKISRQSSSNLSVTFAKKKKSRVCNIS